MKITAELGDEVVLAAVGQRLAQRRLACNWTQARLAGEAGVSKRTIERLESGGSVQSANLVRVLRVLGLLQGLDAWLPDAAPGPMRLLRDHGRSRKRASTRSGRATAAQPWQWDEDA